MSQGAIELRGLTHTYPDGTPALRGVDLRIQPGESVAVVGANGAGKSTLLAHLNGLLWPSTGDVLVGGIRVTRATLAQVRGAVGFVFQDADDQLFMPTVQDDVAFGPSHQALPAQAVETRVHAALEAVGAAHLRARAPYRLSGGEKRAVAIAGVLAMQPSILALDEPSAGLDPAGRRRLIGLLRSLPQTRVIATHDLDLVLQACQRVLVLHDGRVEADGAPEELFADRELLQRCHLEPPGSRAMATPRHDGSGPVPEPHGDHLDTADAALPDFSELTQVLIASRQNIAPKHLQEPGPDAAQLDALFVAAAAAPDHGEITPWRFVIVPTAKRALLAQAFASALVERDPAATPQQIAAAAEKAHRAPLLMLAVARLGAAEPDVPAAERLLSLGCAIQNMLLAAHAMGFGCGLTSGRALDSAPLRALFGLADGEAAVCCVNVGTPRKRKPGRVRPAAKAFVSSL
jgi:cobalt/nickel transport system ATP-binding protein